MAENSDSGTREQKKTPSLDSLDLLFPISSLKGARKFVAILEEEKLQRQVDVNIAIEKALKINEKFGFEKEIIQSLAVIFFSLAQQNNSQNKELKTSEGLQDSPKISLKNLKKKKVEMEFLQTFPRNYVESRNYPNEKKAVKLCKYFLLCQLILWKDYDQKIKISYPGFEEKFENSYDYYSQFLEDLELAPIILAYLEPYFAQNPKIVENTKLQNTFRLLIKTAANSLLATKIKKQNQMQQHQNQTLVLTVFFDNKVQNYSFLSNYESRDNQTQKLIHETILEMKSKYHIFFNLVSV